MAATPPKPSALSKVLARLTTGLGASQLSPSVRSLRVVAKKKHGDVGERQFVKEVLPRLAYANPNIRMDVKYYMPRANSAQAAGEGQGGAAVEEAATATEGSEAADSAEASTSASAAPSPSEAKVSSVELDFGTGMSARKIFLTGPSGTGKSAGAIMREILELSRFNEGASTQQQQQQQQSTPAAAASAPQSAPEPSSTNLAGSAEGHAAGAGAA